MPGLCFFLNFFFKIYPIYPPSNLSAPPPMRNCDEVMGLLKLQVGIQWLTGFTINRALKRHG